MDRRAFLRSAAAGLGAAALPGAAASACLGTGVGSAGGNPGLQLYTLRRPLAQEPRATLSAVAEIGYREVELAGLHGRPPAEFRRLLDAAGLSAPSGHSSLSQLRGSALGDTLADAQTLGHRWIVLGWIDAAERTRDGYERLVSLLGEAGRRARDAGLRVAYHNHDFEFENVGGITPYDVLLERTDPALVDFEMDLYWIRKGGRDPLPYFERWPGRFPLVHVKDMTPDGRMANVGEGNTDFARIFARAEQAGIRHYFVEHDEPRAPIEDVRASYGNLRKLLG